jgi:hypothetical protein
MGHSSHRTPRVPIPRSIDSQCELPKQVTVLARTQDDRVIRQRRICGRRLEDTASNGGIMSGEDRRRRAIAAQGFAAIALFVFAHGARAATPTAHFVSPGSAAAHVVAR